MCLIILFYLGLWVSTCTADIYDANGSCFPAFDEDLIYKSWNYVVTYGWNDGRPDFIVYSNTYNFSQCSANCAVMGNLLLIMPCGN